MRTLEGRKANDNTTYKDVIMKQLFPLLIIVLVVAACSGSQEEVRETVPVVKADTLPPPPEEVIVYDFTERYFVRNAAIGDEKEVENPLQALRVIQMKEGTGQVLVISAFEDKDGGKVKLETWLGIEMPSFAPGRYDLSDATQFRFFRFYLGGKSKRMDGERITGGMKLEKLEDGYLYGSISAEITGQTKSFDSESAPITAELKGSFRIQEVRLEDTIIKGKKY